MKSLRDIIKDEYLMWLRDFTISDDNHSKYVCYSGIDAEKDVLNALNSADKRGMSQKVEELYKKGIENDNARKIESGKKIEAERPFMDDSGPAILPIQKVGKNPRIIKLCYYRTAHSNGYETKTFTFEQYVSMGRPRYLVVKRKIIDDCKKSDKKR